MENFALHSCDDDACSICLDQFTDREPATVTACRHEYHLQCILEWAQRSRECPICWQSLALTDPDSQELLAAVEVERSARTRHRFIDSSRVHVTPINPEFTNAQGQASQDTDSSDLDERIMQHLRAAAINRAQHFTRREQYISTRLNYSQQLLPDSPAKRSPPNPSAMGHTSFPIQNPHMPGSASPEDNSPRSPNHSVQEDLCFGLANSSNLSGPSAIYDRHGSCSLSILASQTPPASPQNMDRSEFLSFSESIKSKLSAASFRYKESISKSTRGFKEKLLSRNNSIKELSNDVKREVTASFAGVARMMERLDPALKRNRAVITVSHSSEGTSKLPCIGNIPKEALMSGTKESDIKSDLPT